MYIIASFFVLNFVVEFVLNFVVEFVFNFVAEFVFNFVVEFVLKFVAEFVAELCELYHYMIQRYNIYTFSLIRVHWASK